MKRAELKAAYRRLREFIDRHAPTHTELRATMDDPKILGEFVGLELEIREVEIKRQVDEALTQAALLDVPQARRGGY